MKAKLDGCVGEVAGAGPDADSGAGEARRFIEVRLSVAPVPSVPGLRLYAPHSGTGLSRIGGGRHRRAAPYWAFAWAGGLALARYMIERPETVVGRRVVDLGAGSGLVGIIAARLGAAQVLAVDGDAFARAAIAANAALNGVTLTVARSIGRTAAAPVSADIVLAGDVFYAADVGRRALAVLDRCRAAGIVVLVGDPYRAHLPLGRLRRLAEYCVPDVGSAARLVPSGVFALEAGPATGLGRKSDGACDRGPD